MPPAKRGEAGRRKKAGPGPERSGVGAVTQSLGQQSRVLIGTSRHFQFLRTAGAQKAAVVQLGEARRNHSAVRQLIAHVAVIHAAGKQKTHRLAGEIFHNEIFHDRLPSPRRGRSGMVE